MWGTVMSIGLHSLVRQDLVIPARDIEVPASYQDSMSFCDIFYAADLTQHNSCPVLTFCETPEQEPALSCNQHSLCCYAARVAAGKPTSPFRASAFSVASSMSLWTSSAHLCLTAYPCQCQKGPCNRSSWALSSMQDYSAMGVCGDNFCRLCTPSAGRLALPDARIL